MNTNVQVLPSASHDHNTMLGAGDNVKVSMGEGVSAETNHEPVETDQLSTDSNVSAQTNHELISQDQLSTMQRQKINLSNFQGSEENLNESQICKKLNKVVFKTEISDTGFLRLLQEKLATLQNLVDEINSMTVEINLNFKRQVL